MDHASAYEKLLEAIPSTTVRLTKHDNEILSTFQAAFPEFHADDAKRLKVVNEDEVKSEDGKKRWRKWISDNKWEDKVGEYSTTPA